MKRLAAAILLGCFLGWPVLALAEGDTPQPSPPQSGQKPAPKTLAPSTVPPAETLEKDVDQATGKIEQRGRDEQLIRESVKTPSRRPDLEHDVEQGIQSENIEKALKRK